MSSSSSSARLGGRPRLWPPEGPRAGVDEIRHAEIGFRFLAALGHDVAPGPLDVTRALSDGASLQSVFRLVVRECLLGETVAAVEAAHVVHAIECPVFRGELQSLAEDEARHAELGFLFAAWAIEQDPSLRAILADAAIDAVNGTLADWSLVTMLFEWLDRFGMSAPGGTVMKELGMTADHVVKAVAALA